MSDEIKQLVAEYMKSGSEDARDRIYYLTLKEQRMLANARRSSGKLIDLKEPC